MHITFNLLWLIAYSLLLVAAGVVLSVKAQRFWKKHFN